ncbi:HAMP domain-containing protein, partial [Actinoplanes sp. NPDC026670]
MNPLDQGKARLRGVPLRVKLVAAVLALVTGALVVISASTTFFLRSYLESQVDEDLRLAKSTMSRAVDLLMQGRSTEFGLPSEFIVLAVVDGEPKEGYFNPNLRPDDLPPWPMTEQGFAELVGEPFTVRSRDGHSRWRMLYTQLPNGQMGAVGQHLTDVDLAVQRLLWIDVLAGTAVLILLASIGAAIVRTSLKPLVEIERTAAAIAGGDLSRRVPDPEEGQPVPTSELGRLSRALNAMLTQIEAAFTARAASESAARYAEAAARDAAGAARAS